MYLRRMNYTDGAFVQNIALPPNDARVKLRKMFKNHPDNHWDLARYPFSRYPPPPGSNSVDSNNSGSLFREQVEQVWSFL